MIEYAVIDTRLDSSAVQRMLDVATKQGYKIVSHQIHKARTSIILEREYVKNDKENTTDKT